MGFHGAGRQALHLKRVQQDSQRRRFATRYHIISDPAEGEHNYIWLSTQTAQARSPGGTRIQGTGGPRDRSLRMWMQVHGAHT